MSAALSSTTQLASEDWQLVEEGGSKPTSLLVQLRRRAYVLPYFRFVCAEGDSSLVKITFTSHLIIVTGHSLTTLLVALASNLVIGLNQPTENEARFGVRGASSANYSGPSVTDITVEEIK